MSEQSKSARQAATESLVTNLVGILVVVGVSLLLARKDWINRQVMAARAALRKDARRWRHEREVGEFRRQVSDYEHGGA